MKKIIFIGFWLCFFISSAQTEPDFAVKVEVIKNIKISSTVRDQYVVPSTEIWHVELTDGTKWVNNGGAGWVQDTGGSGDFMADGSVPATGDFDMDANSILDIDELSFRKQDSGTDVGSIFMPDANRWYFTKSASSIGAILNLGSIASSSKTFTFPNTSGTVALTSDLNSYVTLTGTQSIDGLKTFIGDYLTIDNTLLGSPTDDSYIRFKNSTLAGLGISAGYGALYFLDDKVRFAVSDGASGNTNNFGIDPSALTASQDLIVTDTDMTWNGTSLLSGGSADNLGNHTATEDLDMGGFALNNATALTATNRVNTEEVRFNPDNTIGSSTDNNTFGFKTGDILYAQRVNQTIELGLDFNALTADKNLVFTDSDITWGGTSLLGSGSGISDIVEDTTPQLGGPLDNNDFAISMNQPGASTIFNWTNSTNAETMAIGFTSDALGFSFVGSSTAGGLFLDYSDDRWEIGTDPILTGGDLIDDDTFATATSSNIPSAESVKAYVDASGGGGLSSTDIDTYGELNTLVADVTLTHNGLFDTFAELNTIVADATLVDTNNAQTLTNKTINADNNAISNIGSAEITNQSITSADIQDEAIGAALIATNAVSTNKIDDMAVTNAKVMDNTVLEPKLNITNAPTDNHILSYNAAGTNFTWIPPSFEVADIGAADKTLTSSDVHKFNYTDDTVIFTLDNSLSVGDELTFAVTDIDSIITVVPDTGVDIIGNGTGPIDGAFQIDSLNIGKVKKLASNLYYAMGYIKPYSPSVSLIVPTLDDINTKLYIDGREFAASSNGASVSPTDQSGNSTPLTSIDITKQTDSDSDPTFSFNGTSSRISLGNNFNFTAGVAQSIGIFISADGFGTGTRFSKRDDATGGSNDHFAIYNGYYYMGNNEGNPSFSSTTNVLITLTKTTGDVWYIYENGTQRATGAWTNETSAVDLLIGAQVNGGGFSDYSTGEIEVFFITNDFITNTEAGTIATEISTR